MTMVIDGLRSDCEASGRSGPRSADTLATEVEARNSLEQACPRRGEVQHEQPHLHGLPTAVGVQRLGDELARSQDHAEPQ